MMVAYTEMFVFFPNTLLLKNIDDRTVSIQPRIGCWPMPITLN